MEREIEYVMDELDRLHAHVMESGKRTKVKGGLREACQHCLRNSYGYFKDIGDRYSARRVETWFRRLDSDITMGKLDEILSELGECLRLSRSRYSERRLGMRIEELQHELQRVIEFQKELRERTIPTKPSAKAEKKGGEDILKKYKSAEKRIFVIMPFAQMFDDVWNGGIERACEAEGFGYLRVDKISLSSWITEDIKKYIEIADVVITDITGNRPNVMFELGWALAKNKTPVVIRQKDDPNDVPFDLKDIRYIEYANSWNGIETLFTEIRSFLKSTSETSNEKKTEEKSKKQKPSQGQNKG